MPEPSIDRWLRALALAGVALLGVAALVTGIDIATRRVLAVGFVGLVDLTQWLVMACAFACIPLTFLRGAQVEVDFIAERFAVQTQRRLRALSALAAAGFMAFVALAASQALLASTRQGDLSPTLAWPLALYWLPVAAGSALAVLACGRVAWLAWRQRA